MFKNVYFTGDTHGKTGIQHLMKNTFEENSAVIILGDAGCNYYLRKKDDYAKMAFGTGTLTFYLLHGNHEEYPANIPSMKLVWDDEVQNYVYMEEKFPQIHYLVDGEIYYFNGLKTLALGGAYSVDKEWRLQGHGIWFASEQMPVELRQEVLTKVAGQHFDLVLTHTAPISWEPTHLFLPMVTQNAVDKTMEYWLEEIKSAISFDCWLFGHFHANELIAPKALMLFEEVFDLKQVQELCNDKKATDYYSWAYWFPKGPEYYMFKE